MGASVRVAEDGADSIDGMLLQLEQQLATQPAYQQQPTESLRDVRARRFAAAEALLDTSLETYLDQRLAELYRKPETRPERLLAPCSSLDDAVRTTQRDAVGRGHLSGWPMHWLPKTRITTYKRHPFKERMERTLGEQQRLDAIDALTAQGITIEPEQTCVPEMWRAVNTFWSRRYQQWVRVMEISTTRKRVLNRPRSSGWHARAELAARTCSLAALTLVEAEQKAMARLERILDNYDMNDQRHPERFQVSYRTYLLTGEFQIKGRSGTSYVIRRLRPTIAMASEVVAADGTILRHSRYLGALCTHPVAYYNGSYAGVLCPTDDVITHLLLILADERRYWSKCFQHAMHEPESGV